jgi:hypothetical protein
MRHGRGEAGPELLVGGEVARVVDVDKPFVMSCDRVRNDEGVDQHGVGRRLALVEPGEELSRTPARRDDSPLGVEDDHDLAALLHEDPPSLGVEIPLRSHGRRLALVGANKTLKSFGKAV